jgi:hypothetical protein
MDARLHQNDSDPPIVSILANGYELREVTPSYTTWPRGESLLLKTVSKDALAAFTSIPRGREPGRKDAGDLSEKGGRKNPRSEPSQDGRGA